MAASTQATESPSPDQAVWNVLANNTQLATTVYNRRFGYRSDIQEAVKEQHGISLTADEVRDAVLKTNQLGLLADWADTTDPSESTAQSDD